jgi:hypothetical protein
MISYGICGCEDFEKIQKEAIVGRFILETYKEKANECKIDDVDTQAGRLLTYSWFKDLYKIDLLKEDKRLDDILVSMITLKGYNDIIKELFLEEKVKAPSIETFRGALHEANTVNELIRKYYQTILIHAICIKYSIDKTNYIEKDGIFQGELNKYYKIVKKRFNDADFDFDIEKQ